MRFEKRTVGSLKLSVVLIFAALLTCGLYLQRTARAAAVSAPEKKGRAAVIERGRTIFMQNCARCHGADGRAHTELGELYGAKDLSDPAWWRTERVNDRRLTNSVTNGKKGGMPAYGKKLSKSDINAVVAFVRALKQ
jgi:cbb3-type cytochrome c oxidase subunit III